MRSRSRGFLGAESGATIVEFALILPILLLLTLGVIEFGLYFMREQVVQRVVGSTATTLQIDPASDTAQDDAYKSGLSMVNFMAPGNYVCAQSYADAPPPALVYAPAGGIQETRTALLLPSLITLQWQPALTWTA